MAGKRVGKSSSASSSGGGHGRSAITGRFVKKSTVERHPKTTVFEKSKKKGKEQAGLARQLTASGWAIAR